MKSHLKCVLTICAAAFASHGVTSAQVSSPKVLLEGQLDTTDLKSLAQTLYRNAQATTDREKAEAIWRYLLTDGRFVKPGVFYHIPGWSYEEPMGEVLDPIKLLNSYGFGLCYQDAPLLQALWDSGGFPHTRVWFLTGHTVAEVFYEGQYHYYDSDMMGYTTIGTASFRQAPVASVTQLERDPSIMLSKLEGPRTTKRGAVDFPWYTADVRAGAVGGLSDLFTTSDDNYLYAYRRYPNGHTMDFTLRPGERMVRYYQQPEDAIRYMPYATDGGQWREFPKDVGSILQVKNGPRSEKDQRRWSSGVIEYKLSQAALERATTASGALQIAMESPYVIIGASFSMQLSLKAGESLNVDTSIDDGHTWTKASATKGPYSGALKVAPATLAETPHGSKNIVAGTYGYLVRFTGDDGKTLTGATLNDVQLSTLFEFNARSLPELKPGVNKLRYSGSPLQRREIPVHAADAKLFASVFRNVIYASQSGQGFLENEGKHDGEMIFPVSAPAGDLTGFDAGGRFLDIENGLAPDKLTAEVRKVTPWPAVPGEPKTASISWATQPAGPWRVLWSYDPNVTWPDRQTEKQMLRWPEVDRSVPDLPPNTHTIYVKYQFRNLAIDDIRLATTGKALSAPSTLVVTHLFAQNGKEESVAETLDGLRKDYSVSIPPGFDVENRALIFTAK